MDTNLKNLIEDVYNHQIKNIEAGPRQFAAETFILELEDGLKYFIKVIPNNKYARRIIEGLPVLEKLFDQGIKNITYPIKTKMGELYVLSDDKLIVLFNYIDAIQTFEYSNKKFGQLIAQIHSFTSKINTFILKENFSLLYKDDFEHMFEAALNPSKTDKYIREMSTLIKSYEAEIRQNWENFQAIITECKKAPFKLVITHGDAPGNILVDKDQNIYLVDWDSILLAPAERDTWFMKDNKEFMDGYSSIYKNYQMNPLAYKFYLYNRYFEDLVGFIGEIMSDKSDIHKELNLNGLKKDCFDEWLRPLIKSL